MTKIVRHKFDDLYNNQIISTLGPMDIMGEYTFDDSGNNRLPFDLWEDFRMARNQDMSLRSVAAACRVVMYSPYYKDSVRIQAFAPQRNGGGAQCLYHDEQALGSKGTLPTVCVIGAFFLLRCFRVPQHCNHKTIKHLVESTFGAVARIPQEVIVLQKMHDHIVQRVDTPHSDDMMANVHERMLYLCDKLGIEP